MRIFSYSYNWSAGHIYEFSAHFRSNFRRKTFRKNIDSKEPSQNFKRNLGAFEDLTFAPEKSKKRATVKS